MSTCAAAGARSCYSRPVIFRAQSRTGVLVAAAIGVAASANAAAPPHLSVPGLPSSNGLTTIVFDRATSRVNQFLEHAYRYPTANVETRDFAYDTYPGVRVGGTTAWLPTVSPTAIEYVAGTGIVHIRREFSDVTFDEYHFTPMGLKERASVMLVKATRTSGSGAIDLYGLFNYRLGSGSPAPAPDGEQALYVASRDAIYEWGASGVAFAYGSIGASSHHAMSPQNPYDALIAASNLADNVDTGGARNDAAAGLQASLGDLAVGASAWGGWYTVLDPAADAQAAADRVRTWLAGRSAATIYADEVAAWGTWQKPLPPGLSKDEASVWQTSQAVMRMAQVTESGAASGQILASLAPGRWNISWVRDMAYSVVALARSGHVAEAKAAITFQLAAKVGAYQDYVGHPYQISVVRYFGNGEEESDSNQDGPNIEFDGFGLFLWELEEYVKASGDNASLTTWWPLVSSKIGDTLVALQESNGLIAADSSIWEVHWKGKERHFAYTTITAAHGLCSAARLAQTAGDTSRASTYRASGIRARDALLKNLTAPDGTLAQSTEGLTAKSGWLDASVVEAFNFGLLYPDRRTGRATLKSMRASLVPPSGRGFMRNDVGGWYDSQEWVFVDQRTARTEELAGDSSEAATGRAWNVAMARENYNLLSELHERTTADYVGESPMVGFGAGSYVISLLDRGTTIEPTCGEFADEAALPSADAGAEADSGSTTGPSGGGDDDADSPTNGASPSSEEDDGCTMRPSRSAAGAWSVVLALSMLGALRKRRRR